MTGIDHYRLRHEGLICRLPGTTLDHYDILALLVFIAGLHGLTYRHLCLQGDEAPVYINYRRKRPEYLFARRNAARMLRECGVGIDMIAHYLDTTEAIVKHLLGSPVN